MSTLGKHARAGSRDIRLQPKPLRTSVACLFHGRTVSMRDVKANFHGPDVEAGFIPEETWRGYRIGMGSFGTLIGCQLQREKIAVYLKMALMSLHMRGTIKAK